MRVWVLCLYLTAEMESLGYDLVDHWERPRDIEIPFHAGLNIDEYSGFYWRHRNDRRT